MDQKRSFLGTGWSFPVTFDRENNEVVLVSDIEDIQQSLFIILNTTPGERIMQPEFGCNLKQLVFEIIDSSFFAKLDHLIYQAILNFEPRVKYLASQVLNRDEHNGVLIISIDFMLISTNSRHNIVFPFYHSEGTNV
ncbi:MAG: GPW/gp25 family protein [Pyrinomonadaceae bacterium]|nr:GPW/gp25 family protein [Sphingobacteriaceae bacterium]